MADDKTFTQEEVNALVGKARLEGKEAGKKEFEGWISPDELQTKLGSLTDQVSALTSEKETLQTQITEKDGRIAAYEIDSVKTRIARELGLSYEAVGFIQGNDEEAIKKSAESLKALVGDKKQPTPPFGNSEPPIEEDGVTKAFKKLNPNLNI
jgi:hypothetical protein